MQKIREAKDMENKWKEVWNRREINYEEICGRSDFMSRYAELKRADGFDVSIGGDPDAYYRAFVDMWKENYSRIISRVGKIGSVFEVGCGSGASLYLYKNADPSMRLGGTDYSESLVRIAKKVIGEEIFAGEASDIPTEPASDLVSADSVFVYFRDEEYAGRVLERMYAKSAKAVMCTEVYDLSKKEECIAYRRSRMSDYDERYKDLGKLFLSRKFWMDFAEAHDADIEFCDVKNPYYWNSDFMYDVFLYRKHL
jgi:trans-aconitate methyltransferase